MAKRAKRRVASRSYYSLSQVVQRINAGHVLIRSNAARDAFQLFGWGSSDIFDAYRRLQPKHFYKTDISKAKPGVYLDFYKATINGERVYTHFYVNSEAFVVINSFKRQ